MIGQKLGHFQILEKLGAGGMGEVFRAHDEQLDREVAIKVLPPTSFRDPSARARLLREARSAAGLNHPHICTIYEVGEAQGQAYIAMELIEGQPLSARLAKGALPAEDVLHFGLQLAEALAHAHERGIVHRDLKSANAIVTPQGRVKVLDFGLAKRLSEEELEVTRSQPSLTAPGALMGTLAYMAPEQLRGLPADARSDVWALGAVLYEMGTGQRPFQAKLATALAADIQYKEPARPSGVNPEISSPLEEITLKCLEKNPEKRYPSAKELLSALQRLATPAKTHPAPALTRLEPRPKRRARRKRMESLVVLPFANLSRDPEQEYFADGMTEELISNLAKLRALKIISRTSAMRYKESDKSLPEIAAELNVDAVVEGSVLRVGQRVRITAQLIHAATDMHLWADSYDRDLQDVLLLQSDVARAIAREIQVAVTPEENKRLASARRSNPEAYEACLKGRFHFYKLSREHLDAALQYFQLALEKDPKYALAYVGIADVWLARGDCGVLPHREAFPRAKAAVLKALELDESLAEVHMTLGNTKALEWDWVGAEKAYRRAIELRPNYADVRLMYADVLISTGRMEEWKPEIERCLELDPLNFFFQCFYGWYLVYLRRYDEAIAYLDKTLRTEPNFPAAHLGLWGAFYQKRMYEEALEEAKKFFELLGDREVSEALAQGYPEGGYPGAMRLAAEKLAARSQQTYLPAVRIARLYSHAGEKERALEWLEKAYFEHETPLVHLRVSWDWDSLREEPRFQDLLRRMNFPQ
jgi:serine/threonine-protein kinase